LGTENRREEEKYIRDTGENAGLNATDIKINTSDFN